MIRKKKLKQETLRPTIQFLLNNINALEYDITTKLSLADHIRILYQQHIGGQLEFEIFDSKIFLAKDPSLPIQPDEPITIRFLNDFRKKVLATEMQIRIYKQNKYLANYVGKLVHGKIASIGNNQTCVVNILNTNLLIDNSKFFRGDILAVDKEYTFLVKEANDNILVIRSCKEYIMQILLQYYTAYNADKIIKIYRNPGYTNYVIVDTTGTDISYYIQRYLSNIEFINEDIGFEKVKFIDKNRQMSQTYLDILNVAKIFRYKNILSGVIDDNAYIIADRLNIWKDTRILNMLIDEIYSTDKVVVHVVHLANDREGARYAMQKMFNIGESSAKRLIDSINQIYDLHFINLSQLISLGIPQSDAKHIMYYLVDFYLSDINKELDIKKYIIANNSSINEWKRKSQSE